MKNSHELRSELLELTEKMKSHINKAREEKRDLNADEEFQSLKAERDELKTDLASAESQEEELRSISSMDVTPKDPKKKEKRNVLGEVAFGIIKDYDEKRSITGASIARETNYTNTILRALDDQVFMRSKAMQQTVDGNSWTDLVTVGDVSTSESAEGAAYSDSSDLELQEVEYPLGKMTAIPKMTEETRDQSNIVNLEGHLQDRLVERFAQSQEHNFWYGDDTHVKGLMLAANFVASGSVTDPLKEIETVSTVDEGIIKPNEIFDLVARLRYPHINKAEWYMSRQNWQYICGMVGSDGHPLLQKLADPINMVLAGHPVNVVDKMSAQNENKILLGDMSMGYVVINQTNGFAIRYDEITEPQFIKYPARMYYGGALRKADAFKCLEVTQPVPPSAPKATKAKAK